MHSRDPDIEDWFFVDQRPLCVFISHALGGGVERHVEELAQLCSTYWRVMICSKVGNAVDCRGWGRWERRFHGDAPDFFKTLRHAGVGRFHVHHLEGWSDDFIAELLVQDVPVWVTLHDYTLLSGSPVLFAESDSLQVRERLTRERDALSICRRDVRSDRRRKLHESILFSAERIIAPSEDCRSWYKARHPDLNVCVIPHVERELLPSAVPRQQFEKNPRRITVLVLGALSKEKGARLLESVAELAFRNHHPVDYVLLGYSVEGRLKHVEEYGAYQDSAMEDAILQLRPDVVWFPAVCPETYSYTLSSTMRLGLPVAAHKMGAFPERLSGYFRHWLLPLGSEPDVWASLFCSLQKALTDDELDEVKLNSSEWCERWGVGKAYYSTDYLHIIGGREASGGGVRGLSGEWTHRRGSRLGGYVVKALLHARDLPVLRLVAKRIPVSVQKRIKRAISRRPLHKL